MRRNGLGVGEMVKVELSGSEMAVVGLLAGMMVAQNVRNPRYDADRVNGEARHSMLERFMTGLYGEMAVAKWLGVWWMGNVGKIGGGDVGDVQVRTVVRREDHLILHPQDGKDEQFVSAFLDLPKVWLRGWVYAREGQVARFWDDHAGNGRLAFWVPPSALRPMATFHDYAEGKAV